MISSFSHLVKRSLPSSHITSSLLKYKPIQRDGLLRYRRPFASSSQQRPPSIIRYQTPRPPARSSDQYRRFNHNNVPFYKSRRLWLFVGTGTVLFGGYYVTHLEKVPISGRTRFMDITPKQEQAMAQQAYAEVMAQYGHRILPQYHPYTRFVSKVAKRLIRVSGMDDGTAWEFHVIDSPERNAFVLPGGKVFVFTGILPIVENEDGMAAVLGHEISHQVARHSAERLSFAKVLLALQLTLVLFGIDPSLFFNHMTMNLMMLKPFSRKCEKEADTMGLALMAQACFDPHEAVAVWRRMEESGTGHGVPQFASTHPSHQNRVAYLQDKMDDALRKRAESDCSTEMSQFADMFRQVRGR